LSKYERRLTDDAHGGEDNFEVGVVEEREQEVDQGLDLEQELAGDVFHLLRYLFQEGVDPF